MTDRERAREQIVRALIELAGARTDSDMLTLGWTPLSEHAQWGIWADAILLYAERTRLACARECHSATLPDFGR